MMTDLDYDKLPTGHLGNVIARLLITGPLMPLSPLDLAVPEAYGTEYMRNLRHARKWLEKNTPFVVRDRMTKRKGSNFHLYWCERAPRGQEGKP